MSKFYTQVLASIGLASGLSRNALLQDFQGMRCMSPQAMHASFKGCLLYAELAPVKTGRLDSQPGDRISDTHSLNV